MRLTRGVKPERYGVIFYSSSDRQPKCELLYVARNEAIGVPLLPLRQPGHGKVKYSDGYLVQVANRQRVEYVEPHRKAMIERVGVGSLRKLDSLRVPPHPKPSAEFIIGRGFAPTRWTSPRKRGEVRKRRRFDLKPSRSRSPDAAASDELNMLVQRQFADALSGGGEDGVGKGRGGRRHAGLADAVDRE